VKSVFVHTKTGGITMPRLNLQDEGMEQEGGKTPGSTPTLRDIGGGGGKMSPLIIILLVVVLIAAVVFALNYFKVIHLWGKKPVQVTQTLPEPEIPVDTALTPADQSVQGPPPATETIPVPGTTAEPALTMPTPEPAKEVRPAGTMPSGTGEFTVQYSAWKTKGRADEEASKLNAGGFDAYVDQGISWYRVRVGRYGTRSEAKEVAARLQLMTDELVYVATYSVK
jgi:cell division septation protein DedD